MESMTSHALKEWAVAVDALEAGKTIILLRKGGIREENGRFAVDYDRVFLYPTYEHQQPNLLKSEYAGKVMPVESGWHPETVRIGCLADITDIFPVAHEPAIKALLPYHIWNEQFVSERLKWKPRQPIYVLLLRAYKLPQPQVIPYRPEYGGCKSWIDLVEPISIEGAVPVLSDGEYIKQANAIRRMIANPELVSS
ncbi:DUF1802 family protein [Microcoleus sp. FACHB-672]|uniref:DUF1802 family protein n=1 Tax=Microcoleus sp. FACHB-672 TaxID=2692825 RepID=UPI0016886CBC|nr:DUF1802 family protein [Microcoleus sp. FACHB-672]MBD2043658.1 DUF1802 family protein [Microcoleus sp. FACHB-672]